MQKRSQYIYMYQISTVHYNVLAALYYETLSLPHIAAYVLCVIHVHIHVYLHVHVHTFVHVVSNNFNLNVHPS